MIATPKATLASASFRGQRQLVREAILKGHTTLEAITKAVTPLYGTTVKHKAKDGEKVVPSAKSWFIEKGGAVQASVRFHLRGLKDGGFISLEGDAPAVVKPAPKAKAKVKVQEKVAA